ncbi:MAG: DUF5011 domain-containing protein [Oscillospiraceae bacterium]|jgi:hypothetical protein|nr:DUF5011 domain-containing protein [Oscillospiraceae bacterium]
MAINFYFKVRQMFKKNRGNGSASSAVITTVCIFFLILFSIMVVAIKPPLVHQRVTVACGDPMPNFATTFIPAKIVDTAVNTATPGTYTVTLSAAFMTYKSTLVVEDKNGPQLTMKKTVIIIKGGSVSPADFVESVYDESETGAPEFAEVPDTSVAQTSVVTIKVTDSAGNVGEGQSSLMVLDGKTELTLQAGAQEELTVVDFITRGYTGAQIIGLPEEALYTPGTYPLVIEFPAAVAVPADTGDESETDDFDDGELPAASAEITQIPVTLIVIDTLPPEILGVKDLTVKVKGTLNLIGHISSTDNTKKEFPVAYTGEIDYEKPGKYTITYSCVDDSGNRAEAEAIVTVTR